MSRLEDGDPERTKWKIYEAVGVLVSGRGNLRERICTAYLHHMNALNLPTIPWPDLQKKYEGIRHDLDPWISIAYLPEIGHNDDLMSISNRMLDLYSDVLTRLVELKRLT